MYNPTEIIGVTLATKWGGTHCVIDVDPRLVDDAFRSVEIYLHEKVTLDELHMYQHADYTEISYNNTTDSGLEPVRTGDNVVNILGSIGIKARIVNPEHILVT